MDLERFAVGFVALLHLLDEIGFASRGDERRNHVLERTDVVNHTTWLNHAGPSHQERHSPATFPVRGLLTAERRRTTVRPGTDLGTVVRRERHDRVVRNAEILELFE